MLWGLLSEWNGLKELLARSNRKIYIQSYSKCFLTQSPTVLQLRKSYDIGVVVSVRGIHIRRGLIDENLGRSRGGWEKQSGTCTRSYYMCVSCMLRVCIVKRLWDGLRPILELIIDYSIFWSIWNISLSLRSHSSLNFFSLSLFLSFCVSLIDIASIIYRAFPIVAE